LAKKVSRKELKEPDEFLSFTVRALKWINEQKVVLIVGALAVVVVILGMYGWRWYALSKERAASVDFIKAREILDARVIPRDDAAGTSSSDGSFASEDDKFRAAIAEFEMVSKSHSNSATAALATYYVAEYSRRTGDYDKAIENFKSYLKSEGPAGELAAFAVEGIAAALEAQGKDDQAAQQYKRLTESPFDMQPDRGLFHVARLEQKAGRTAEAKRLYNEIVEKYPKTNYMRDIQDRLSLLEDPEAPKGAAKDAEKKEEPKKEEPKKEEPKKEAPKKEEAKKEAPEGAPKGAAEPAAKDAESPKKGSP
jgi:tetratricopeptide (TPR) repeat protein